MRISEMSYNWNSRLETRGGTKYIVLHHRGGDGDVMSIHKSHQSRGWAGIGYHFYVRKNGEIWRGRPQNAVGAHCVGFNAMSVGVCFEGNYENEKSMPKTQKNAGREIVAYLRRQYPNARVVRHGELTATACPGKYFPFDEIAKGAESVKKELSTANDIVWEISQRVKINDVDGLVRALDAAKKADSPLYWALRKMVNA